MKIDNLGKGLKASGRGYDWVSSLLYVLATSFEVLGLIPTLFAFIIKSKNVDLSSMLF
mgnify:FL=1